MIAIIKCGGSVYEINHDSKPGNRGKRDSQLVLMNALNRSILLPHSSITSLCYGNECNDVKFRKNSTALNRLMTPLDFEIISKTYLISRALESMDFVLMVDADTVSYLFSVTLPYFS
jgi:hypothetical protein